jgi:zinc/manganese transport system substrate-binding protein
MKTPLKLAVALLAVMFTASTPAQLKVASLHPLLGDLARQVGGDKVEVVDLLKPGADAHHFEPTTKDLAALKGVKIIFASGKKLEAYLPKITDTFAGTAEIVEVGRTIPSIKIEAGSEIFMCCPAHTAGGIDPHWWHSADNMRRAARVMADSMSKADPGNAATYKANAEAVGEKLTALKSWAQEQIAAIPRSDRKLVTSHASFGYFCKEYGFKTIPLLGISREDEASLKYVSDTIKLIKEHQIRAVFADDQMNPKVLTEIVRETGVKVGKPLVADGTSPSAHTFETMLKHNVQAIVSALKP